ncbi:MAG TPA: GNAT family N-acetyltransferase [Puia sp.]
MSQQKEAFPTFAKTINSNTMNIQHNHTERGGSFYIGDPFSPTAQLVYRMAGEHKMIIDHTEVAEIHKGEGIGKQLVAEAVHYARQHGIKILPLCSFARSVLKHSKEYEDVLIAA